MAGDSEQDVFANNGFYANVSAGLLIPDILPGSAFGRNIDIDVAEDVWTPGGFWVAPPAAGIVTIISTDASDTLLGTGLRTVLLSGLDDNGLLQSEVMEMNGLVSVASLNTYSRVNNCEGVLAGSNGANAGLVSITQTTLQGQMGIGTSRMLSARFSVPSNRSLQAVKLFASITRPGAALDAMTQFEITKQAIAADSAKVYMFGQGVTLNKGLDGDLPLPTLVPPSTDILFSVTSVTDTNTIMEAGMLFILRKV